MKCIILALLFGLLAWPAQAGQLCLNAENPTEKMFLLGHDMSRHVYDKLKKPKQRRKYHTVRRRAQERGWYWMGARWDDNTNPHERANRWREIDLTPWLDTAAEGAMISCRMRLSSKRKKVCNARVFSSTWPDPALVDGNPYSETIEFHNPGKDAAYGLFLQPLVGGKFWMYWQTEPKHCSHSIHCYLQSEVAQTC